MNTKTTCYSCEQKKDCNFQMNKECQKQGKTDWRNDPKRKEDKELFKAIDSKIREEIITPSEAVLYFATKVNVQDNEIYNLALDIKRRESELLALIKTRYEV